MNQAYGAFRQNDKIYETGFSYEILDNILLGKGSDYCGEFEIKGKISKENIIFLKYYPMGKSNDIATVYTQESYRGKPGVLKYVGEIKEGIIKGKWMQTELFASNMDYFYLNLNGKDKKHINFFKKNTPKSFNEMDIDELNEIGICEGDDIIIYSPRGDLAINWEEYVGFLKKSKDDKNKLTPFIPFYFHVSEGGIYEYNDSYFKFSFPFRIFKNLATMDNNPLSNLEIEKNHENSFLIKDNIFGRKIFATPKMKEDSNEIEKYSCRFESNSSGYGRYVNFYLSIEEMDELKKKSMKD